MSTTVRKCIHDSVPKVGTILISDQTGRVEFKACAKCIATSMTVVPHIMNDRIQIKEEPQLPQRRDLRKSFVHENERPTTPRPKPRKVHNEEEIKDISEFSI